MDQITEIMFDYNGEVRFLRDYIRELHQENPKLNPATILRLEQLLDNYRGFFEEIFSLTLLLGYDGNVNLKFAKAMEALVNLLRETRSTVNEWIKSGIFTADQMMVFDSVITHIKENVYDEFRKFMKNTNAHLPKLKGEI